jgi:hypothetical protein
MADRRVLALLTALAVSALVGCTSTSAGPAGPARSSSPSSAVASAARATTTPGTGTTTGPPITAPAFRSAADRDTAFIAQLAAMTWASPDAGPGYPARFRRSAMAYESQICHDVRQAGSVAGLVPPTDQLDVEDRARLITLAVSFYCPTAAGSSVKRATHQQKATCPKVGDILVTSRMSPAMMSDNYFSSSVTYVIAFMNLTDFPVWIQPEIKWTATAIYKGDYPTGDGDWRHSWQVYSDPRVPETTPGRLLEPGEVWRVDAGQSGPYSWKSMSARVDPAAFVPAACGYQPA